MTPVWGKAKEPLREAGFVVEWVGDWQKDPGDEEILRVAAEQQRVLITLDKDFGLLAIHHGRHHCGIIRLVDVAATSQAPAIIEVIQRFADDLADRAIITVEPGRIRVRIVDSI